jgi:hypothetical protein
MPNTPSLSELITILRQGTDGGFLQWKETAEQNTFRCSFGKGTVEITSVNDLARPPRYGIILFDEKNTLLEDLWASSEGDSQAMGELYDRVRRSVLHIDQAIQALMKEIQIRASGQQQ